MLKYVVVAASVLMLSACGEPKLDGSSEEAMKKSAKAVSESLPAEKRSQFEADLSLIALSKANIGAVMSGKTSSSELTASVFRSLDGKTAVQVSSEASAIRVDRERREREEAASEVSDLRSKQAAAESAKAKLAQFAVTKSRFYKQKSDYSYTADSYIEIAVKNGTEYPISRAYFRGTLATPGRAVPWVVEDFNYSISGGIEPGESMEWDLKPNSFGKWGQVSAPADAVLTVDVVRLDGADGKPLFDSEGFSERDAERLESLLKKYQN